MLADQQRYSQLRHNTYTNNFNNNNNHATNDTDSSQDYQNECSLSMCNQLSSATYTSNFPNSYIIDATDVAVDDSNNNNIINGLEFDKVKKF